MNTKRSGRPPKKRFLDEQVDYIKEEIQSQYGRKYDPFYLEVFTDVTDVKNGQYMGLPKPTNVETVARAFKAAFERPIEKARHLPEIYMRAMEHILGISHEDLLSIPAKPDMQPPSENPSPNIKALDAVSNNPQKYNAEASESDTHHPPPFQSPLGLPSRGNKSLADWFNDLSLHDIHGYLRAIPLAQKKRISVIVEELRDPQCVNVLAEKLVKGPLDLMTMIFFEFRDFMNETLRGVCATIDANSKLSDEHFKTVAQADFVDLNSWFSFVADFFGEFAVVQASHVERCFIGFAATPAFLAKNKARDLETICYAIEGFSRFKCSRAIKVLVDCCFEDGGRLLRAAEPNQVREFAALIGKDIFRNNLEKIMDSSNSVKLLQCLKVSNHKRGNRK